MPEFSLISIFNLNSCDSRLHDLFVEVVKTYDCSIICGFRNQEEQTKAFESGKSKLQFPDSKHNEFPSMAVDVYPYPIAMDDLGSFYMFAGYVLRVAKEMGINVRYGGDWDGDKKTADQTFHDLGHWEIIP